MSTRIIFRCHEDGENLSARVGSQLGDLTQGSDLIVFGSATRDLRGVVEVEERDAFFEVPSGLPDQWRILVECSQGHANVFENEQLEAVELDESEAHPFGESHPVVSGRPPTAEDLSWARVADEVAPDKALPKLQGAFKGLVANLAVLTALLSGFGAYKGISEGTTEQLWWLALPILLAGFSVAIGTLALQPTAARVRSILNLKEVRRAYETVTRWRVWWLWAAAALFAASLVSVPLVIVNLAPPEEAANSTPALAATWTPAGEGPATLKIEATVPEVPAGGEVVTEVSGTKAARQRGDADAPAQVSRTVGTSRIDAPQGRGEGKFSVSFPISREFAQLNIQTSVVDEAGETVSRAQARVTSEGRRTTTVEDDAIDATDEGQADAREVGALAGGFLIILGSVLAAASFLGRDPLTTQDKLAATGVAALGLGGSLGLWEVAEKGPRLYVAALVAVAILIAIIYSLRSRLLPTRRQ